MVASEESSSAASEVLSAIARILEERKSAAPESSYVAGLYAKGSEAISKKIGEEAVETIIAAHNGSAEQLIHETADLWFHSMVMLAHHGLSPEAVIRELQRRFGVSGLQEKQSRG